MTKRERKQARNNLCAGKAYPKKIIEGVGINKDKKDNNIK